MTTLARQGISGPLSWALRSVQHDELQRCERQPALSVCTVHRSACATFNRLERPGTVVVVETDETLARRLLEKAAWHEAQAARYRTAAEVVAAETQESSPEQTGSRRRTDKTSSSTAMALEVVTSDSKRWTVNEIMDEMLHRGWQTNATNVLNTVRTATARLASQGSIRRVGNGLYQRLDSKVKEAESPQDFAFEAPLPPKGDLPDDAWANVSPASEAEEPPRKT